MRSTCVVVVGLIAIGCHAAAPVTSTAPGGGPTAVRVTFTAQSDSFAAAVRDYQQLWAAEGTRMIATLEAGAGLRFVTPFYADTAINVIVFEGVSQSGYRDEVPMMMRASYSPDTKKATLLHELGHRLMDGMFRRDEDPHAALFLWLYDVWIAMYGQTFADEQVAVEKRRGGPYPAAWDAATRLSPEGRRSSWAAIVAQRPRGPR